MKKIAKLRYGFIGFLVGAVFFCGVAFASNSIDVNFISLKFFMHEVENTPKDNKFNNNGEIVPASFIYKGTTYLPIRLISNMFNTPITWDGANKSIHIGNSDLKDMKYSYLTNQVAASFEGQYANIKVNKDMKMDGQGYEGVAITSYADPAIATYNLNAEYKTFSFVLGMDSNSTDFIKQNIQILGDGKELYQGVFYQGITAQKVKVGVENILKLEIRVDPIGEGFGYTTVDFAYPLLTSPKK